MTKKGKRYTNSSQKLDRLKRYSFQEAVGLTLDCAYAKFDESVELAVWLGVDPWHADQMG